MYACVYACVCVYEPCRCVDCSCSVTMYDHLTMYDHVAPRRAFRETHTRAPDLAPGRERERQQHLYSEHERKEREGERERERDTDRQ